MSNIIDALRRAAEKHSGSRFAMLLVGAANRIGMQEIAITSLKSEVTELEAQLRERDQRIEKALISNSMSYLTAPTEDNNHE